MPIAPKFYGMTEDQLKAVDAKLENQRAFLENSVLVDNHTGEALNLKNAVISAYHSPHRFYGEIQNRVNTLVQVAFERNLKPLFLTLTLPSRFHAMKEKKGQLVPNPRYDGTKPKKAAQELTRKLARLRQDRSLKGLSVKDRIYFRAIEPHEDGTPHLHLLLFVPPATAPLVTEAFKRLYHANTHERKANTIEVIEGEAENAVRYVMKYINKVLPLSKAEPITEKERYLHAWYSLHRISRFSSSRSLAPLGLYRLLHNRFSLYALTKVKPSLTILEPIDQRKIVEVLDGDEVIYERYENFTLTTGSRRWRERIASEKSLWKEAG